MFTAVLRKYTQNYAVTVTLHPKVRKYTAEEQYNKYAHDTVVNDLKAMFPNSRMSLVVELTKSFDIHFHGVIQFDMAQLRANQNIPRWFRDKFRNHKIIGFVLLKVIDNDNVWDDYIQKSIDEFKKDLSLQPILIDDLNKFQSHLLF